MVADRALAQPAISEALDTCCEAEIAGVVVLVEEPELYLGPPGQRCLYRTLRRFVETGNQVIYSTHAPTFLNAAITIVSLLFLKETAGKRLA